MVHTLLKPSPVVCDLTQFVLTEDFGHLTTYSVLTKFSHQCSHELVPLGTPMQTLVCLEPKRCQPIQGCIVSSCLRSDVPAHMIHLTSRNMSGIDLSTGEGSHHEIEGNHVVAAADDTPHARLWCGRWGFPPAHEARKERCGSLPVAAARYVAAAARFPCRLVAGR